MKAAWDLGINTIDTANIYSNGESGRLIGKFIKKVCLKITYVGRYFEQLLNSTTSLFSRSSLPQSAIVSSPMILPSRRSPYPV
jgi:hypothetical protein